MWGLTVFLLNFHNHLYDCASICFGCDFAAVTILCWNLDVNVFVYWCVWLFGFTSMFMCSICATNCSQRPFTCTTSQTTCTAGMHRTSVRFIFCITVTAHGLSKDIVSEPRCQAGRKEGEVVVPLLSLLFLFYVFLTLVSVFLSDVATSNFEQRAASQRKTSVFKYNLETYFVCVSCVEHWNWRRKPEFPNWVQITQTGQLLQNTPQHHLIHIIKVQVMLKQMFRKIWARTM